MKPSRSLSSAGFSLTEVMVALAVSVLILGAAVAGSINARRTNDLATQLMEINGALRASSDIMVRDLLQTGQGFKGTTIEKPTGAGATLVRRPGPGNLTFPLADVNFPMVITGAALGPAYVEPGGSAPGPPTDIITVIGMDSEFEDVSCSLKPNQRVITVDTPTPSKPKGRHISSPLAADPILEEDLLVVNVNGVFVMICPTAVQGQSIHYDQGDVMNVNQSAVEGTASQFGNGPLDATFSRIRMITYFIDNALDPPRLMRQLNFHVPRTVAMGIENLQLSYDLSDGAGNPTNIESPGTPNQIRKVNVYLAARSRQRSVNTGQFLRNSLSTQVSLRNLAFVDRYPDQ